MGRRGNVCAHACTSSGNHHSDPNWTSYTANDLTAVMLTGIVSCGKGIPVKGSTMQRCDQTLTCIYHLGILLVCDCKTIPISQYRWLQAIINSLLPQFFYQVCTSTWIIPQIFLCSQGLLEPLDIFQKPVYLGIMSGPAATVQYSPAVDLTKSKWE